MVKGVSSSWPPSDSTGDCQTEREERDHGMVTLPSECRQREVTEVAFHSQTEREERDHGMVTLPSECRQRKDSYLAPWGGKGGEASRVHPLPWGRDTFHFMEEYRRRSVVVGHRVRVVQGAVSYEAEATGIADDGALVVRLADGSVQHLRSGEISLRPILGSSW